MFVKRRISSSIKPRSKRPSTGFRFQSCAVQRRRIRAKNRRAYATRSRSPKKRELLLGPYLGRSCCGTQQRRPLSTCSAGPWSGQMATAWRRVEHGGFWNDFLESSRHRTFCSYPWHGRICLPASPRRFNASASVQVQDILFPCSRELLIHDQRIDETVLGVLKRARQTANNLKAEVAPQFHRSAVGADHEVELHGAEAAFPGTLQRV